MWYTDATPNYKAVKRNKLAGAALKNLDKFRKQNVEEKSELYVQYVQYDVIFIKVNNMQNKPVYCFVKKNKKKNTFFFKKEGNIWMAYNR